METTDDGSQNKTDDMSPFESLLTFVNPEIDIVKRRAGGAALRAIMIDHPEHPWSKEVYDEATQRLRTALNGNESSD